MDLRDGIIGIWKRRGSGEAGVVNADRGGGEGGGWHADAVGAGSIGVGAARQESIQVATASEASGSLVS